MYGNAVSQPLSNVVTRIAHSLWYARRSMNYVKQARQSLKARTALLVPGLVWLAACTHTERLTREMTWSTESSAAGMNRLPGDAVRLTFVQSPKFHVRLQVPGLGEHLKAGSKRTVSVGFEIQCKRRKFALIRIRSVDGVSVQTNATNMLNEIDDLIPGKDAGPFPYSCRY